MSDIRFNRWLHQSGTGGVYQASSGNVGIGTSVPSTTLDVNGSISATSITATTGTITGNLSVGGVLTYEDVTNIDAVGVITARSDVSIADKIVHTGDTNTAIRFPAADTFTVETGGSERVRIDSAGNFGINKNAPTSVLDVRQTNTGAATEIKLFNLDQSNATTQTAALVMTPDVRANGVKIVAVKEVADMSSSANKDLALTFQTVVNNTAVERLRITSAGNLGIGDASPTKPLTVGTTTPVILLDDQSSRTLEIRGPSTTHSATVLTTSVHDLLLGTNNTERLRITSDGRIGIGMVPHTSSTGYALQIDGGASSFIQIFNDTSGNTLNDGLVIGNDANTAYFVNKENTPIVFRTNNTERLRIASDGTIRVVGDNQKLTLGAGDDLELYHDGSDNVIATDGPNIRIGTTGENFAKFVNNGAAELYYDNTKRFETMSSGVKITSNLYLGGSTNGGFSYNAIADTLEFLTTNGGTHSELNSSAYVPGTNGGKHLGNHNKRWNYLFCNGIRFGGENSDAHTLDDYEEGTWTPTMGFATSYGTQSGKYVKIGKAVHIWFEIQVTAWSTYTGSTRITNNPFPIDRVTGCWAAAINATATTRDWRIGPWTAGGYGMAVWMENGQGSATSAGVRMSENTFSDYSSLTGSLGTNFTMKGGMTYISTT